MPASTMSSRNGDLRTECCRPLNTGRTSAQAPSPSETLAFQQLCSVAAIVRRRARWSETLVHQLNFPSDVLPSLAGLGVAQHARLRIKPISRSKWMNPRWLNRTHHHQVVRIFSNLLALKATSLRRSLLTPPESLTRRRSRCSRPHTSYSRQLWYLHCPRC